MFRFSLLSSIIISVIFISNGLSQPSKIDYLVGYGGLTLVAASELFKDHIGPEQPNWVEPNNIDLFIRDHLKWENKNLYIAELISDVIVKGIVIPSIFWTPLLTNHDYNSHLLLNVQVLAATGFLINVTKFLVSRQRPYSYFNTFPTNGRYDNLSFYSGHTALPFALTTSSANILQKSYPHSSGFFWVSGILLSSIAGYLRIASDHHYLSDVLTGAIIGSLSGYFISRHQSRRFFTDKIPTSYKTFNFSITF